MKIKQLAITAASLYLVFIVTGVFANPVKPGKKNKYSTHVALLAELSGNIEYGFSKSTVRPIYYSKLNKLAVYLIDNNAALTLRGYADSIGSFKGNWKLSEKRAIAVKTYLVNKGVNDGKVVTTAFGSTKPITSNNTAEGRQKNRRVEIKVNPIQ